ncbi:MAG: transposase [Paracoccaceae bacterium]|nr:transposase [Paracoccaceae bacterium]
MISHSTLAFFRIRLNGSALKHGSFDGIVRPLIEMAEVLAHALVPLLDARLVLYQHFLELDPRVERAASHDDVCMRMMTVPGVGPIAALTFKAAVDDPARFKRSWTVAAHFGLTPRRYQSAEHDNPGRISKAGDPDVHARLYSVTNALLMRTMARSQIKP